MCTGLHVKYPLFFPILTKLAFSRQIFEKFSNIKSHENPSSGSRDVPYGRTDGRTVMTKQIVAFRNFANAPKRSYSEGKKLFRQTHTYARMQNLRFKLQA